MGALALVCVRAGALACVSWLVCVHVRLGPAPRCPFLLLDPVPMQSDSSPHFYLLIPYRGGMAEALHPHHRLVAIPNVDLSDWS